MLSHRVRGFLVGSIIVLLVLGVVGFWFVQQLTGRRSHSAAEQVITVEPGMGTREIVARLARVGIVGNQTALLTWLAVTGQAKSLKAGDYQFASPISPLEAIDKIRRGDVATHRVTVPEGLNRFEISELLAEKTGLGSRDKFVVLTGRPELIRDLDSGANSLEGYLFPDTYEYTLSTTPEELIEEMVDRFREIYKNKPEFSQVGAERNITLREIMTMASMVEEEARVDDERPVIASVFYNRLSKDMKLASDPTFIYAAVLAGDYDGNVNNPKHRQRPSPYNTYMFTNLPPGPIANPGLRSIEAALAPADTQYLYFVVNGKEGRHKFSRTVEEHDAAVLEYRKQQREENGK